jgi:hypothetical protein
MDNIYTDEELIEFIQSKILVLQNKLNEIKLELDNNEKTLFEILLKKNQLKN